MPLVAVAGVAFVAHHTPPVTAPSPVTLAPRAYGAPAPRAADLPAASAGTSAVTERTAVAAVSTPAAAPIRVAARRVAPIASASADHLREQAEALDDARGLLALGQANQALSRLDEYDRRFAGGPLREEAQLLRIETVALEGERAAAASLAKRFLRAYPGSVHVDRVAAILQSLSP